MNTAVETTLLTQQKRIVYSANCAQSFQPRVQPVENICEVESSKRLKIRVSLVRFQSRPPIQTLASAMLLGFSAFSERSFSRDSRCCHFAFTVEDLFK